MPSPSPFRIAPRAFNRSVLALTGLALAALAVLDAEDRRHADARLTQARHVADQMRRADVTDAALGALLVDADVSPVIAEIRALDPGDAIAAPGAAALDRLGRALQAFAKARDHHDAAIAALEGASDTLADRGAELDAVATAVSGDGTRRLARARLEAIFAKMRLAEFAGSAATPADPEFDAIADAAMAVSALSGVAPSTRDRLALSVAVYGEARRAMLVAQAVTVDRAEAQARARADVIAAAQRAKDASRSNTVGAASAEARPPFGVFAALLGLAGLGLARVSRPRNAVPASEPMRAATPQPVAPDRPTEPEPTVDTDAIERAVAQARAQDRQAWAERLSRLQAKFAAGLDIGEPERPRSVAGSAEVDGIDAALSGLLDQIEGLKAATDPSVAERSSLRDGQGETVFARLAEQTDGVAEISAVIAQVAHRTNMVALNATIEAARAGEAGRGFAVVAKEVKDLAQQTGDAVGRINGQIEAMRACAAEAAEAIAVTQARLADLQEADAQAAASQADRDDALDAVARAVQAGLADIANIRLTLDAHADQFAQAGAAEDALRRKTGALNAELQEWVQTLRAG
ncbi:MAG: methyl-accepting chemotaxis protein [Maricaulaceae bacterium]